MGSLFSTTGDIFVAIVKPTRARSGMYGEICIRAIRMTGLKHKRLLPSICENHSKRLPQHFELGGARCVCNYFFPKNLAKAKGKDDVRIAAGYFEY